jgi:hypothetical protein
MRCPALEELPPPPAGPTGWPWTEGGSPVPPRHTEQACRNILSLPMYPELSEGQGRTVAELVLARGRGE